MSQREMGDRLVAQRARGNEIDLRVASSAIQSAVEALQKQAKALADSEYGEVEREVKCPGCAEVVMVRAARDPKAVGQTMAYTAKVVDEVFRLLEFAQGRADSRPDQGMKSILSFLTDQQLGQLEAWVAEGKSRGAGPAGETLQ